MLHLLDIVIAFDLHFVATGQMTFLDLLTEDWSDPNRDFNSLLLHHSVSFHF